MNVLVVDLMAVVDGLLLCGVGGTAIGVRLGRWFLIGVGFGALFMVVVRRYRERAAESRGGRARLLRAACAPDCMRFLRQPAAGVTVPGCRPRAPAVPAHATHLTAPQAVATILPGRRSILLFMVVLPRSALLVGRAAGAPQGTVLRERPLRSAAACPLLWHGRSVWAW